MREQVGVSPQLVNIKPVLLTIGQTAPDKRLSTERTLGQLVSIPSMACVCVFVSVTSLEGGRERETYLGLSAGLGFSRELDLGGFKDGVLLEDVLLGLVMTKGLERKHVRTQLVN